MFRNTLSTFLILVLGAATSPAAAENAVADWNEVVLAVAEAEDGFMTLKGVRTAAMLHLAMQHALRDSGSSATDADRLAAVTVAAHRVAASQYPGESRIDRLRERWLPSGKLGRGVIARGTAAADAVLAERRGDGWDNEAEYAWHPMAPGVYAEFADHSGTPEGFIFGAGWAKARGFALKAPDQFRVPPPPDIQSEAYRKAFDEVKALGRFQSMQRTPDQTHIALWWKDFVESSHNRLARDLARREGLDLRQSTRLFSLLNMAIFDAYVASFDNKFHYNHWRPYTAIRWAKNDGNPATLAEETWTNTHRHTYAFPSYPSAHGTACGAAMAVMTNVFGEDYAFDMRTEMVDVAGPFSGKIEMQPPTRSFKSFREAASECGRSRVYLGIHFDYDSIEGVQLGFAVGENVVDLHATN